MKTPMRAYSRPNDETDRVAGGELRRRGLEAVPVGRDVGVGQSGCRPQVGVDDEPERREVLRRARERAVDR